MAKNRIEDIVADLPRRIVAKIRGPDEVKHKIKIELDADGNVRYSGYLISISLDGEDLVVQLTRPNESSNNLPTLNRMKELLRLENRAIISELGLDKDRINRANNYLGMGVISVNEGNLEKYGKNIPIPQEISVRHRLTRQKKYDPTKFFQAAWDLGIRPLVYMIYHSRIV